MTEAVKHIQLLSNEPCREDAFEGHAHEYIAVQIARILKEDARRHIIGIEGDWGSGKSNLISLVNKNLNGDKVYDKDFNHKDSQYPFFVYDAWGHQADYQRRAILEELTHDLTLEKKILDEQKWKTKLEQLLAKRRKTTTKEVPSLGIGLVVGFILTILTPLVVFLVNLVPENYWWLRILLASLPYIIGIWYAIHDRGKSLKKNGQKCTTANVLKELILVYKDQIKENETYTTISEKEPSSAEFKTWMEEVDKDLKASNKALVIVFDNMDRLPSQKVESLWSSIHSFFSDKTYDNIKVLIPFDRQHVKKAFKNEDAEGESYGNDFINKTFDVVFRVPPPIMSGWQQYMTVKWKEAFDGEEVSISVLQIYDVLNQHHTPRKIIAFINAVATVKMTITDDIPERYIALFVLGQEEIDKDPIGQLLNPTYMGDVSFEYTQDADTIKYLSALYYQLPVEKALDVVFTQEAIVALNSGNGMRLNDMQEHIDLSTILGNAILKVTDVEKATAALAALDGGYGDYGDMPGWLLKIWGDLYQKSKELKTTWNEIKDYHAVLFSHLYDKNLAQQLVQGYHSIPDDKWDAKRYVEAIDKLNANNDIVIQVLGANTREVTPKLFLDLLTYTKSNYEDYGVSCDLTKLDEYLSGLEQKEAIEIHALPYVEFDADDDFPNFKKQLTEWISETAGSDAYTIGNLFTRLKEISSKPLHFSDYFGDAAIVSCWNQIDADEDEFRFDLLAMRIARRGSMSTQNATLFSEALDSDDDAEVTSLAAVIEYYVSYGDLLLHSDYYKDFPLVVAVFRSLTEKNVGVSRANINDCLVHFEKAVSDYDIDADQLFERLSRWNNYLKAENLDVPKQPNILIETAQKYDSAFAKKILVACDTYFTSLGQDQWKDHILRQDDTWRLWKLYHPKKYQANFDALKAVLKDYAGSSTATQPAKTTIDAWLSVCLDVKHSLRGLFNEISAILKKDSNINKAKLLFFGKLILEYSDLEKQHDFVEKLIPTEIIDADVVMFMAANIERLRNCTVTDEFREKIKHLAQISLQDDEHIQVVAESFGIDMEEIESE